MKIRKILSMAIALTLVLALSLSLAACGSSKDNGGDTNGASYTIGYNTWGSGTATFDVMADYIANALETLGSTGNRVSDEHNADTELANAQNFISAGVDGVAFQCSADPVLLQAAAKFAESKTPFVLDIFVGDDADREEVTKNNEYYAGSVSADLWLDGYLMGQAAAADGNKKAVLVGGNVGDNHFEQRIAGFTQSFVTEGGGVILDAARCTSPAESVEKSNAVFSANRDADCAYAMVGDYVPGVIKAIEDLGLEGVQTYASNAGEDAIPYIRDGRVSAGGGGNDLPAPIAIALLINYIDGHPIKNENGLAPNLIVKPFTVTIDNVDDFVAMLYTDGVNPIADDVLQSLLWRYNPDVTYQDYLDVIDSLTIEGMMAAHNK